MNTIEVGTKAPEFELPDQDGKTVRLSDFAGKSVLLYFYPKDNTPGCTKEACSLRDSHQELTTRDVVVLGVSPDSPSSHKNFIAKQELPFTLLSDPEARVIKAYGAWGTKSMYGKTYEGLMRWTFLIGPDGVVEQVWRKVDTAKHGIEVLSFLDKG